MTRGCHSLPWPWLHARPHLGAGMHPGAQEAVITRLGPDPSAAGGI